MTSSSSPGISLKQEAISYMAGSRVPAVIVNMNRGGPGLGDIGPSQGDYYQSTRGGGHGDYRLLVLGPSTVQEAYDLTMEAFDLAFKYRNPVMVLGDAILGQMKESLLPWLPESIDDTMGKDWQLDGRGGKREKRLIKSLYLEEGALAGHNLSLQEAYEAMQDASRYEEFMTDDAELIICAYGSIARIVKSTIRKLRKQGHKVGLYRPITLYPFPSAPLEALADKGKKFLTIEHNLGQMVDDVRLAIRTKADSRILRMPARQPAHPGRLRGSDPRQSQGVSNASC